jgi:hypothetical protein
MQQDTRGTNETSFDCETILAMEEMGVGVDEILQYARVLLPRREVRALCRGLEAIVSRPVESRELYGDCLEDMVKPVGEAVSDHTH